MKRTRAVDRKWRLLKDQALLKKFEAIRKATAEYERELEEIRQQRQAEIDALPELPPRVQYREDRTPRFCVVCNGQFALATIENAKLITRLKTLREGKKSGKKDKGWQYRLAQNLRNPRQKYCCYCCQQHWERHAWDCILQSEVAVAETV
jgi:hypothetical protein